jgi:putative membrane protein
MGPTLREGAMLDLTLAIAHHLLVFSLCGVLFAEFALLRPSMDRHALLRLASIDLSYGVLAGLIVVVGLVRAHVTAKGWDYYSHNGFFWGKMATFIVIGLLSVPPTIAYIRWKRAGILPSDDQVKSMRRYLYGELALFVPLLACAAAMARGYGAIAH